MNRKTVSLFVVVSALGCGGGGSADSPTAVDAVSQDAPPPVLKNLGVTIDSWNPSTRTSGAITFNSPEKIFIEFGLPVQEGGLSRGFEFRTVSNAEVRAACDGVVTEIDLEAGPLNAEIHLRPSADSPWVVAHRHIKNPTVTVGAAVKAGDVIGATADWSRTIGKTVLAVTNTQTGLFYAPFRYFETSLLAEYQLKIWQLMIDWENYKLDPSAYDESKMIYAGSYVESFAQ